MKVLIHASSAGSLERARSNARDLLDSGLRGTVRLVVSHGGAIAALDRPDPEIDPLMILCADGLLRAGREVPASIETTPNAALLITGLQRKGWAYLRA